MSSLRKFRTLPPSEPNWSLEGVQSGKVLFWNYNNRTNLPFSPLIRRHHLYKRRQSWTHLRSIFRICVRNILPLSLWHKGRGQQADWHLPEMALNLHSGGKIKCPSLAENGLGKCVRTFLTMQFFSLALIVFQFKEFLKME